MRKKQGKELFFKIYFCLVRDFIKMKLNPATFYTNQPDQTRQTNEQKPPTKKKVMGIKVGKFKTSLISCYIWCRNG